MPRGCRSCRHKLLSAGDREQTLQDFALLHSHGGSGGCRLAATPHVCAGSSKHPAMPATAGVNRMSQVGAAHSIGCCCAILTNAESLCPRWLLSRMRRCQPNLATLHVMRFRPLPFRLALRQALLQLLHPRFQSAVAATVITAAYAAPSRKCLTASPSCSLSFRSCRRYAW